MTSLNVGDKGQAICEDCEKLVETTYQIRDIPLSDSRIIVPNLLVGVCNSCDKTVSIPAQNTAKIKEVREKLEKTK